MKLELMFMVAACMNVRTVVARPVIVLGFDGQSPLAMNKTGSFAWLEAISAYTYRARTVPEMDSWHAWRAIFWSGYEPDQPEVPLFQYLRSQKSSLNLWVIASYSQIYRIVGNGYATRWATVMGAKDVVDTYLTWRQKYGPPDLAILYSKDADDVGHESGWSTVPYNNAVRGNAAAVRHIYDRDPDTSKFFMVSDHGGVGRDHRFGTHKRLNDPLYRDTGFFEFPVAKPGPICRAMRVDDTVALVVAAMTQKIKPHPNWRVFAGPPPTDCPQSFVSLRLEGKAERRTISFFLLLASLLYHALLFA